MCLPGLTTKVVRPVKPLVSLETIHNALQAVELFSQKYSCDFNPYVLAEVVVAWRESKHFLWEPNNHIIESILFRFDVYTGRVVTVIARHKNESMRLTLDLQEAIDKYVGGQWYPDESQYKPRPQLQMVRLIGRPSFLPVMTRQEGVWLELLNEGRRNSLFLFVADALPNRSETLWQRVTSVRYDHDRKDSQYETLSHYGEIKELEQMIKAVLKM